MVRFTLESSGHKSFLSLVFVFVICLVNYLVILYIKRIERKEPGQVPDFWFHGVGSLRASSPIWASETSLARTREQAGKPRGACSNRRACSQATAWVPDSSVWISYCKWDLDSWFQSLVGLRILWAISCIPKSRIPQTKKTAIFRISHLVSPGPFTVTIPVFKS